MLYDYFLYSSCLPPDSDASLVGGIVKQARAKNALTGITGVLGFDGENFIQYVEGPRAAIDALRAALARDDRHVNFTVLSEGADVPERAFSNWQMGYADVGHDPVALEELRHVRRRGAGLLHAPHRRHGLRLIGRARCLRLLSLQETRT